METKKVLGILTSFLFTFCISSCNDDDFNPFPEGTSSLYMMNEDNGKITLGNSDVYITNEGNFKSHNFPIFDMGEKQGISDIGLPDFINMAPEVAVYPKHGYVFCSPSDVRTFNSQKKAIRENADVYRVFVESWIRNKDGEKTGANVYFLLGKPIQHESNQMPAWESGIGTLEWDFSEGKSKELSVSFPSNDIEVSFIDNKSADIISYSIKNNTFCFLLNEPTYNRNHEILIRHKNVYTSVYITVKASN